MAETAWRQNLITLESDPPLRLWTGPGSLTLDEQTYLGGGQALGVSEYERASGEPDRRLRITLTGIPTTLRARFLLDSGPLPVTVEWIHSADRGKTWTKVPALALRGRMSSPSLAGGSVTIEIETQRGDVERGRPLRWSHEDQQRRHPGDLGLEHMRALSQQGVDTKWPP